MKKNREHNEEMEKERKISERETAVDAAYKLKCEMLECRGYKIRKENAMQTCGTEERRKANLDRWGYSMDTYPRFNGGHEAQRYDGMGADPCDERNNRSWLLIPSIILKESLLPWLR